MKAKSSLIVRNLSSLIHVQSRFLTLQSVRFWLHILVYFFIKSCGQSDATATDPPCLISDNCHCDPLGVINKLWDSQTKNPKKRPDKMEFLRYLLTNVNL